VAVGAISDNINKNYNSSMRESALKNLLVLAVTNANVLVNQKAHQNAELNGMGTTVVLSFIKDKVAHIAHAGDSRAYLISNGMISQITRDHTMVQYLVETGEITKEEAKTHPKKHLITRALGVQENIDVEYNFVSLQQGDKILMCTDGLTNLLESDEILEIVNQNDIEKATDMLVESANERGGFDNITVVIMECV
jgi:protein phosphatase